MTDKTKENKKDLQKDPQYQQRMNDAQEEVRKLFEGLANQQSEEEKPAAENSKKEEEEKKNPSGVSR